MAELNLIPQSDYIDACNAVREKDGSTGLILSGELGAKIREIPVGKPEQSKTVEITANGDYPVTPDVGKVLSEVIAKVNVPTGGGGGIEWCHVTIVSSPSILAFGFYGRGVLDTGQYGKVDYAEGCNGLSGFPKGVTFDLYMPKYSTIVFTPAFNYEIKGITVDNAENAVYGLFDAQYTANGAVLFIKGDANFTITTYKFQ